MCRACVCRPQGESGKRKAVRRPRKRQRGRPWRPDLSGGLQERPPLIPRMPLITRLMIPVFFCLLAAGGLRAEEPRQGASAGPGTLDFADPRLKATGHEWMAFGAPDKFAFVRTMFSFYGMDEETHDIKRAVELLDLMYLSRRHELADGRDKKEVRADMKRDALLNLPVHLNFMYILNDTESPYGVRYFLKEGDAPAVAPAAGGKTEPDAAASCATP